MIPGIGSGEILLIGAIVLLLFGSKEIPGFIRGAARLMGTMRRTTDKIRRELETLSAPESIKPHVFVDTVKEKKAALRERYRGLRDAIPGEQHRTSSRAAMAHLVALPEFAGARSVMLFASSGSETYTHELVREALAAGKRVVVPYYLTKTNELGIAAIDNFDDHLKLGESGVLEPVPAKRDNFLKSDLQLIVCPGLVFDRAGGRLGNGNGSYDRLLSSVKQRVPTVGLAFRCQILDERLPFAYHDVAMDQVVTEEGPLIGTPSVDSTQSGAEAQSA